MLAGQRALKADAFRIKIFGAGRQVVLSRMHKEDAVQLVHQAMRAAGLEPQEDDTRLARPEVEALLEAVNCHARGLVLKEEESDMLVGRLQQLGLAEAMPYGFFRFHPALCPYLLEELGENEERQAAAIARWAESMKQLSDFLYQQLSQDAQMSLNLTNLELPNLVRLLEHVRAQGDAEATVDLATKLEQLLTNLGRKQLLAWVAETREKEAEALPDWSHMRFEASRMTQEGDCLLFLGRLQEAAQAYEESIAWRMRLSFTDKQRISMWKSTIWQVKAVPVTILPIH